MVTPKEYTENLKNHIITTTMLEDALFSVNKRAKNWRDQKRSAKNKMRGRYYYSKYDSLNISHAEEQMEKYYKQKEALLAIIEPICIHQEFAGYKKDRIYEYMAGYDQTRFNALMKNRIIWENCYYDYDLDSEVYFFDQIDPSNPEYRYYLYYGLGDHSFHTPITKADIQKYPDLQIVTINTLDTDGYDIGTLVSTQFVAKLIDLIKSGEYEYIHNKDLNLPKYDNEDINDRKNDNGPIDYNDVWRCIHPTLQARIAEIKVPVRDVTLNEKQRIIFHQRKVKKNGKIKEAKYYFKPCDYTRPKDFAKYVDNYIKEVKEEDISVNHFVDFLFNGDLYDSFYKYRESEVAVKHYCEVKQKELEEGKTS